MGSGDVKEGGGGGEETSSTLLSVLEVRRVKCVEQMSETSVVPDAVLQQHPFSNCAALQFHYRSQVTLLEDVGKSQFSFQQVPTLLSLEWTVDWYAECWLVFLKFV